MVVLDGESLTFGNWFSQACQVARGLAEHGVRRGDRVVVPCAPDDWPSYAVAYVAVQLVGATAVPVLRTLGSEHLRQVCVASGALGVLGEPDSARVDVWCATVGELARGRSAAPFDNAARPTDDAEILYTSGTTGAPKGVVATHTNLLFTHSPRPRRDGVKVVLHATPPGSLAGQGLLLQPLDATRHRVVTMPRFDPRSFLSAIPRYAVTDVVLVPALALALLQFPDSGEFDLSSVEVVRTMSAPIPPAALERLARTFTRAATVNLYTTTESWPARTRLRFDPTRSGSVGRGEGAGGIRITGDDGRPVAAGVEGNVELRLKGAPVRRYLDEPREKVFLPDGWVRTGDIGRLDADGYLYLIDRNADLVISGGLNVSTIEVEAALQEFPGVAEAAVFGLPHRMLGEYVVAAVRPAEGYTRASLNEFLAARLGPVKAPKRIIEVADFPRNAMGKVVKQALRERFAGQTEAAEANDDRPVGERARTLHGFWADALGTESVPWTVSFVELGGTSLSAMEIVGRVRTTLHRQVSQRDLFEVADLREFADRVAGAPLVELEADALGPIRRVRRG